MSLPPFVWGKQKCSTNNIIKYILGQSCSLIMCMSNHTPSLNFVRMGKFKLSISLTTKNTIFITMQDNILTA